MEKIFKKNKGYNSGSRQAMNGFTIVELVISIFIVSIAVVGIFNALSIIIILTSDSGDRLTATYLAQEGMEIIRNIRDTNWLNMDNPPNPLLGYSWVDGITENGFPSINCSDHTCEADYKASSLSMTQGNYLYLDSNGFYIYNPPSLATSTLTKFQRRISVIPVTDVDGVSDPYHILKVKVAVSWNRKATVLGQGVSANLCCPGGAGCPSGVSNCIITEGTLYNWYRIDISVIGVVLSEHTHDLYLDTPNEEYTITAIISPSNATIKSVSWSFDNTILQEVSQGTDTNGNPTITVKALKAGSTTVIATTTDRGLTDPAGGDLVTVHSTH
jgi:Tfp pilus assembly protein PilV